MFKKYGRTDIHDERSGQPTDELVEKDSKRLGVLRFEEERRDLINTVHKYVKITDR